MVNPSRVEREREIAVWPIRDDLKERFLSSGQPTGALASAPAAVQRDS